MVKRTAKRIFLIRGNVIITMIAFLLFTGMDMPRPENGERSPVGAPGPRYSVEWVTAFPGAEVTPQRSFGRKMSDIFLGKSGVALSKPLSVVGTGPSSYWVLDQGVGVLLQVRENQCLLPPAVKKNKKVYPSLAGLTQFDHGRLLFTDSRLNRIFVVSPDKKTVTVLNDTLTLQQPVGIAWSGKKREIWVAEARAHRLTVLDAEGKVLRHIGRRGTGPGEFNFPTFIWIDKDGTVYIVDSMNFRVQILDADGKYLGSFGKIGDASGYFARPKGIAVDTHGHIYVADALYNVIQIYDRQGNLLYYFGSQGHGKGEFWMPGGLFIDGRDYIYVADTYNARVQVFHLVENNKE